MNVKNLTPFPFGTRVTSRRPPRPEMTLILRAAYVLAPGAPLALPETPGAGPTLLAQGPMSAETYREEDDERAGLCLYPGDFADFKPRAEVLLEGTCHTPGGKPLSECPVRFGVGTWSKLLRVIGRRFWSDDGAGAVMSETAPFTKMPLDYSHAFGGPGYAQNPVGMGFAGRELPNVEHAGQVIQKRRDDPGPAGFGPISPAWPQRAGKVGKEYGARWRKERRRWYAEDFDWTHFQAAPPDQQLEGYLRGDETLLFQNLHPTEPLFETRLPGIRIRAFVKDDQARFREVAMGLDTLFANLHEGRLYLTWRGLDAVESDELRDVATVLVASEKLEEVPLPAAHYRELLEAFEADPLGMEALKKEIVPAEMLEKHAAMEARLSGKQAAPPPAPEAPAPDPVTASLRKLLDQLPGPLPGAKGIEEKIAGAIAAATAAAKKAPSGPDLQARLAEAALQGASLPLRRSAPAVSLRPGGPPPAWAGNAVKKALDEAGRARSILAGQKLSGDAAKQIAARLDELDGKIEAFAKEPFFAEILRRPAPQEPGPEKDLSGQDHADRDLSGADLRGADLRNANLAGTNLRGAKLAGACLEGAVLVDADLAGADLTGADLTLANFTGARAPGAILRGTKLDRAFFQNANLEGAVLAAARGQFTFLPEANLAGADCKAVVLTDVLARKAVIDGADFEGASLTKVHFIEASGKKASFSRASLDGTSFMGADLSAAVFADAKGSRMSWMNARLDDADFCRAAVLAPYFLGASALRARFRRAVLKEARCHRAAFDQADFTESNLLRADFTRCTLGGTLFTRANLYDAKFREAAGEGCDFSGANLKRAAREGA